jgi:RNase H-like domain found in reverse transcriptase
MLQKYSQVNLDNATDCPVLNKPNDGPRVAQYGSRTLTAVKQKYSNTQRELLAIVWAVTKKFRFYTKKQEVYSL